MPPPLDREMLKAMKRADLQRICKEYGIKANLKTEALIELLVDTTQAVRPTPPPPPPQRAPSTRIASRSVTGPRLRGPSSSSVIIHDTDDEDLAFTDDQRESVLSALSSEPDIPPRPPTRPRRAKDTQYKLGVGRPAAAGGNGARAVTRTASLAQKGRRGKGSKSVKPTEAAIQEEEEPDPMQADMPEAGPSGTTHESPAFEPPTIDRPRSSVPITEPTGDLGLLHVSPTDVSDQLKIYIANLVSPLQTQVEVLRAELQQRSGHEADLSKLRTQVFSLQAEVDLLRPQAALVPQLQAEVLQLKQSVALLSHSSSGMTFAPSQKSLGKVRASDEGSSGTAVGGMQTSHPTPSMSSERFIGLAQSLLGKRQRDSNDSQITDIVETGQEGNYNAEEMEKRVVRPTKKRPKLSSPEEGQVGSSSDVLQGGLQSVPRTGFTIFQGPEEPPEAYMDPPPPTTHLSDLFPFDPDSGQITPPNGLGGAIARPPGADENAPQQLPHNFNFSFNTSLFNAVTSTPFDMNLPPFTYPEPPASPSPAAPSGGFVERAGGRIERNDLFQPLRRPTQPRTSVGRPASRTSHNAESSQLAPPFMPVGTSGTVDPSAFMGASTLDTIPEGSQEHNTPSVAMANGSGVFPSVPRRIVSSTEIGLQLGMSSTLPMPPDTPGAPMKRTMYGTELEGDTRFGDFGVEGIASGFWAGLTRRL